MQQQWHTHSFRAMGSQMKLWLEHDDASEARARLHQAKELFQAAEKRLTRFAETSELSQLNQRPEQWVTVSNVLWHLLGQALQLAQATNGLFDPTILPALEAAGYTQSFELLDKRPLSPLFDDEPAHCGGWQTIQLDPARQATWLPAGVRLDLGGIGKGATAQQAANFLSQWGACLVDAGGDLVAGDGPTGWPGWPVGIAAPWIASDKPARDLLRLWLRNNALATSGVDYRRWGIMDAAHHLIDPRTGQPAATDLLTVTVLAANAARAEAWATAALVAGQDDGLALLEAVGLPAVLIDEHQRIHMTDAMHPLVM